jgi:serine/threonine-protein kinase HipA
VIRWEAVALELAANAGISTPPFELHVVDRKPVLVVRRFDREAGRRIGYVSAMTMLEASDRDPGSYVEIAEVIEEQSDRVVRDLAELWRRIAFSVLISNTDDHLRNHGFLRTSTSGWSLSPAFDLNPVPGPAPKHLSTAIDGSTEARVDAALEAADLFRLDRAAALVVLREVAEAVSGWERVAIERGLPQAEIEIMGSAFRHDQSELAESLTRS